MKLQSNISYICTVNTEIVVRQHGICVLKQILLTNKTVKVTL
jgi:hypothetical protein